MIFQILEICRIELVSMNSKIIVFSILLVFPFLSGPVYITYKNVYAFEEINKSIFKNSPFTVGDYFISDRYDTINQDNNYTLLNILMNLLLLYLILIIINNNNHPLVMHSIELII